MELAAPESPHGGGAASVREVCELLAGLSRVLLAGDFYYKFHKAVLYSLSSYFTFLHHSQMAEWTTAVFQ